MSITQEQHSHRIPSIRISPERALIDEALSFQINGLDPNETVSLCASLADQIGNTWAAEAKFRASSDGCLDLSTTAPLEGNYDWPDTMGLLWSMHPSDETKEKVHYVALGIQPYTIRYRLETADGNVLEKEITRICMKDGVKRQVVRENGLFGALFLPSGKGPHPALLLVSGSEGGLNETRAAQYASHGFAALALAYFNYESLPKELVNIPLEYFEKAIHFLQQHPEINREKIGVSGGSRGGELSLLLGATFSQFKAVVAYVPSGWVWGGLGAESGKNSASWMWKNRPIPWIPYDNGFMDEITEMTCKGIPIPLTPSFLRTAQHATPQELEAARIPVERTNGAVLLISGEDDQMWPSTYFSNQIIEHLKRNHFSFPCQHLSYPGAGHTIMTAFNPMPPSHSIHPVDHNDYAFGGNPKDNAFAMADSWPRVLQFLALNLR